MRVSHAAFSPAQEAASESLPRPRRLWRQLLLTSSSDSKALGNFCVERNRASAVPCPSLFPFSLAFTRVLPASQFSLATDRIPLRGELETRESNRSVTCPRRTYSDTSTYATMRAGSLAALPLSGRKHSRGQQVGRLTTPRGRTMTSPIPVGGRITELALCFCSHF
jgi:hypothetical protein